MRKKTIKIDDVVKRQRVEAEYHDRKVADGEQHYIRGAKNSYYQYFESIIGDISGKDILDLGCGDGWFGISLVKKSGRVLGIDISHELLKIAKENSKINFHEGNLCFARMAAEDLAIRDNLFDMVIGSAILHHTNITLTIKDIKRILKKDGRAIFIEPMNENLVLKLWRTLTPWRRSPLERALVYDDILDISKIFPAMECRYFGLLSIVSEGLLILFPKSNMVTFFDRILNTLDRYLLRHIPFLGRYCAVVVMNLTC